VFDHHRSIRRNTLAMERRQNQTAPRVVSLSFAGQQAFTEDALCLLESTALGEVGILCHQYVANVVRMTRKEHLPVEDFETDEVSMAVFEILKKSQGTLAKSQERKIE